jgi:DHA1 family bicyclomycin/chloramphenicol resistance-like MFS transporter
MSEAVVNPRFVVVFVAALLSFQPISTDIYLPSLQIIRQDMGLSVVQAQSTLLGLLLGFAVSQLFWGHFSDRMGRKRILMLGAGLYTLSAMACALADSGPVLIGARVAMGCGLAAMVVCGRAVMRDLFDVHTGQQAFAKALTGMAIAATLSGVLGGMLARTVPWRGTMALLGVLSLVVLLVTWRRFDESHTPEHRPDVHWLQQLLASWRKILGNRAFLFNTGLAAFTYTEAILFIGGSSLVLVGRAGEGVSPATFGLLMTCYSGCFLTGTVLCRSMLRKGGRRLALIMGSAQSGLGLLAFVTVSLNPHWHGVAPLVAAQVLYMLGHGFNQVCSQAGAVAPFPKEAGTAAALSGTLMILCAVCMGQLQALALSHTPLALSWFAAFNAAMVVSFGLLLWRMERRSALDVLPQTSTRI